jgi:hypothetical protein
MIRARRLELRCGAERSVDAQVVHRLSMRLWDEVESPVSCCWADGPEAFGVKVGVMEFLGNVVGPVEQAVWDAAARGLR